MDESVIIEKCIELGAFKAAFVDVADIVFERELRALCEANSCGNYGRNYMCPPNAGDADTLIAKAKSYSHMLVMQTVSMLEDSFDIEGMGEAGKRHTKVSLEIDKLIDVPHIRLNAGGCNICERCGMLDNIPCRHEELAVPSLETYCINVSKLARIAGMKYINGQNTVTFFSGYLFN